MDHEKKPTPFPPPVEPDEEDEDEAPRSSLADPVVQREAEKAIHEIEEEMDEERPKKARPTPVHTGPEVSFVDKAWDAQYKVENRLKRIGHGRYGRVIKMARKPEPEEFAKASQITGLGILVVGFIGFLILLFVGWLMDLLGVK